MKRSITLFYFLFLALFSFSQNEVHTFFLKDGSFLEGIILEIKDDGYRIQILTGNELEIKYDEIEQIREGAVSNEDIADYGANQSLGISLLGPGLFGVHFRSKIADELFLDAGVHRSAVILFDAFPNGFSIKSSVAVSGGLDFFLKRIYRPKIQNVRANGLFLSGYYNFGKYDHSTVAAGWASEYFKEGRFHRSILVEFGPSIQIRHWVNDPSIFSNNKNQSEVALAVYLRLVLLFHIRKGQ